MQFVKLSSGEHKDLAGLHCIDGNVANALLPGLAISPDDFALHITEGLNIDPLRYLQVCSSAYFCLVQYVNDRFPVFDSELLLKRWRNLKALWRACELYAECSRIGGRLCSSAALKKIHITSLSCLAGTLIFPVPHLVMCSGHICLSCLNSFSTCIVVTCSAFFFCCLFVNHNVCCHIC